MDYVNDEAYRRRERIRRKRRRRRIRRIKRILTYAALVLCIIALTATVVFVSKKLFKKEKSVNIQRHVVLTNLDK